MAVYKHLSNSEITQSASDIIVPFIDNKNHEWYPTYGGYHTGIDISGESIYSYRSGVVTQIGTTSDNLYTIVIQYTANVSLRYANLSSVFVSEGDVIQQGQYIGIAKKFVHFEYLTAEQGTSRWPVRVDKLTYYKQNPEQLFDGTVNLNANDWSKITIADTTPKHVTLTEPQKSEFDVDGSGGSK